ncbi:MAG: cob(I)yrinic acid a,c-diamide adenosyltransferase [Paludibacteraceae bacterium]|nr:cob(I)yrinic acid a,c-diamide adenosyltransferase [Paludibacteraceae bacterium]
MKISTKTGDNGSTSLLGNTRVGKDDPRVEAYGTLDELNSFVGWLKNLPTAAALRPDLEAIQRDLTVINAIFAADDQCRDRYQLAADRLDWLEGQIGRYESHLEPLTVFPLPGETPDNAACNICRTVCRRAERRIFALHPKGSEALAARYINRLSDYFYVLGRFFVQKT